jgi:dipeptidyl aminopeptidase/acylaminoacyl peptidase
MLIRIVLLLLTLSLSSLVPTLAAAPSFTLEQVMKAPFASLLTCSPKEGHVAWVVNSEGHRNIWIATAPDWKGHQLTQFNEDDGQEIDELTWMPDGSALLFARGGDFETGRDNPNPAVALHRPEQDIWLARINSGETKKLAEGHAPSVPPSADRIWFLRKSQVFSMLPDGSDAKSEFDVQGSAGDLDWSPDGRQFAFTNRRSGHSFIAVYTPGAKTLHFLDPSVDSDESPVWSPDSKRIAFLRIPAPDSLTIFAPRREGFPWSLRVADAESGKSTEVFCASTGKGSVFHETVGRHQVWWTAGNHLVFPWERTGWLHLYRVTASGGPPAELTPGPGEVEHVAFSPDRQTIYYSTNIGDIDRRHVWSINPDMAAAPKQLSAGDGIEWQPEVVPGTSVVALLASSYNSSAHAEILNFPGERKNLAPEAQPSDFPAASLVKPEPVMITAADGMQLHAQLFLPKGSGKHPALVFFHGGSRRQMLLGFHYMYYYSNAYAMNQYLASRGYVVLAVNYRSGIGYGLDFREALNYGAAGASEYNDVQGAGLYLKSRDDVDPKRIGVWGGSYGGYLTALALARSSDLFAAGVDFHGVHDWNIEIPNFNPSYDPRAHPDFARIAFDSSPLASVATWKSPVLLIHGDDDRNVPFAETVRLVAALRQQHVYFEQLIFPNEIHDFLLWRDWLNAYQHAADFFARKLVS